jgi:N-acylneuraminate cytidylyltransferase
MSRVLCLIPARGGSKGIPCKNIKPLVGKPLIYYTIDAALENFPQNAICVSTDSLDIKSTVEAYGIGVPFIRPPEYATDSATSESVVYHALQFYQDRKIDFDIVVLLQPTSPLRTGKHVREALRIFLNSTADMVVSVKETKSNPYYLLFEENNDGFLNKCKEGSFTRRQDCPIVYELNGAIYIFRVESFLRSGFKGLVNRQKYLMEGVCSVDIDTPLDWMLCESIMREKLHDEIN